jgi:hypothetical protein
MSERLVARQLRKTHCNVPPLFLHLGLHSMCYMRQANESASGDAMSYSKRILFGDDSADDGVRRQIAESTEKYLAAFRFKIPTRRRNPLKAGPYWDGRWGSLMAEAARALNIESVQINEQRCFKTKEEADAAKALAEENYKVRLDEVRQMLERNATIRK